MEKAEDKIQRLEEQVVEYRGQLNNYDVMQGVIEGQFKKNEKQLKDLKKINKAKQNELEEMNMVLRGRTSLRGSMRSSTIKTPKSPSPIIKKKTSVGRSK